MTFKFNIRLLITGGFFDELYNENVCARADARSVLSTKTQTTCTKWGQFMHFKAFK